MLTVKVTNTTEELKSLPVTRTIDLLLNKELDLNTVYNNIVLTRVLTQGSQISLVEPYSYNLTYIKELYGSTEYTVDQEVQSDGTVLVKLKPSKPLEVDSRYILYVSKEIADKALEVIKDNEKGSATITASTTRKDSFEKLVVITSTSRFLNSSHIVTFTVDGEYHSLNIKTNNKLTIDDTVIIFEDKAYVEGEEFLISFSPRSNLDQDVLLIFKTAASTSIKPIDPLDSSTSISNQDVINFYQNLNKARQENNLETLSVEYIDINKFKVTLPEGFRLNKTATFDYTIKEAFSNYLLKAHKLFNRDDTYSIYIVDHETYLIIDIIYNDDTTTLLDDDETPLTVNNKARRPSREFSFKRQLKPSC